MRFVGMIAAAGVLLLGQPTYAQVGPILSPPVAGAVAARFSAPGSDWGPGHRGIDYAVAAGTAVRAAATGTVTFAGRVAGTLAVTIDHGQGLSTTYSRLSTVLVSAGAGVTRGTWIGTAGSSHGGSAGGLHFGVKHGERYVDPTAFLGPTDSEHAFHLAPLRWRPLSSVITELWGPLGAGEAPESCRVHERGSAPPNDNVVVAVAGLDSQTKGEFSADLYEHGPEQIGYPPQRVYRFSYAAATGPRLHEPYLRGATYRDIRASARRLRSMLVELRRRHPGRAVDLIAHSQGGIVARTLLAIVADEWDPALPPIEHLVTFASPHTGAPLAAMLVGLRESVAGDLAARALSAWSRSGATVPDPLARSVRQLRPGSGLMNSLARRDVFLGTRVLTLGIANDAVVPADRTRIPGRASAIVGPAGINGHAQILTSNAAWARAHAFLRDADASCRGSWDLWGPRWGRAVSWAEDHLDELWRFGEDVAKRAFRPLPLKYLP